MKALTQSEIITRCATHVGKVGNVGAAMVKAGQEARK